MPPNIITTMITKLIAPSGCWRENSITALGERDDSAGADGARVVMMLPLEATCSPHGAKRNAGTLASFARSVPDCASLHPDYGRSDSRLRGNERGSGPGSGETTSSNYTGCVDRTPHRAGRPPD